MTQDQLSKLKPEQKLVKIAEVCGYERRGKWWSKPGHKGGQSLGDFVPDLPDYLNDLNAMHEAEKTLTLEQGVRYRLLLAYNSDGRKATFATVEAALCHATASQRADALLLTIG